MGKDIGSVVLFGLINTFMVVPISISFCEIIFRDEVYDEYMPSLVKLVLFSSAIHQLCFSLFSSLPFAVGQVQDAGLIFLSAMAASVAASCSTPENIVPTTLFMLGSSTAILGVMLIIVSKLRLASVVQYLPMPVIGGYLAFIGFFCGEAGLSMMAGVQVTSITQWNLFLNRDAFILLFPGLICGLGLSYCLHKFPSPLTFPIGLITILSLFYSSMFFSGSSFQDMRDAGWISPLDKAGSPFDAWKLYDITKVEWNLFPKQVITLLGMFLVVAFSSSLDVAAIEMELGLPLDYNRELNTVGISNLVSGLFGGYTGSYIFTQTTFNMRRGINNRLCGYIIFAGEIIIALLPISVVSFIPKMFFGSLLVLIATELLCEWLIFARTKMMHYEYAVCLLTFVSIQMVGIELGMLIGVIAAMFSFVISYSNLQSVSAVTVKSSTVIRTFEERSVLIASRGKVLTVSLNGYLFFGSAVKLLQEIKSKLVAAEDDGISPNSGIPVTESKREHGYSPSATNSATDDNFIVSPPPTLPSKLTSAQLKNTRNEFAQGQGSQSSVDDVAPTRGSSHPTGEKASSHSAFEGMIPLLGINNINNNNSNKVSVNVTASYQQQQQRSQDESDSSSNASSYAPMRMLFASHSLRQKQIPTVYDLSADQIQSHYQSWANAQKPGLERKSTMGTEKKHPSTSDLEMGSLKLQSTISPLKILTPTTAAATTSIPITERTSLLTAAINTNYTNMTSTSPSLSSSLTPRGLEDVKEIRESSVFVQVWESQQQRKEQQRRRRSFSDLANLACSPGHSESDSIGGIAASKPSLGYNYDSQDNLEDIEKVQDMDSELGSLLRGHSDNKAPRTSSFKVQQQQQNHGKSAHKLSATSDSHRRSFSTNNSAASSHGNNYATQSMLQSSSTGMVDNSSSNNNNNIPNDTITEYLILDFTGVMGVDATAARACFLTLVQFMRTANVTVVFAHLSKAVEDLLRAHNVLNDESIMIPNLDDALEWCEDQILIDNQLKAKDSLFYERNATGVLLNRSRSAEEYSRAWKERQQQSLIGRPKLDGTPSLAEKGSLSKGGRSVTAFGSNIDLLSLAEEFSSSVKPISARALRHILVDYLGLDLSNPSNRFRQLLESSVLTKFFTRENIKAGEIIFDIDFPATKVFFIESGTVEIVSLNVADAQHAFSNLAGSSTSAGAAIFLGGNGSEVVRVNKASHGGVFGEADFILGKSRTVRAYSVSDCTFWILDREHFAAMEVQQPQLCMLIQYALLRSLALSYTCSMYALHPTTAYADTGDDV